MMEVVEDLAGLLLLAWSGGGSRNQLFATISEEDGVLGFFDGGEVCSILLVVAYSE